MKALGFIALLLVFPLFYCFILSVLAFLGGWTVLASLYRAKPKPHSFAQSFQSGKVGFVNYGSCLFIASDSAGIYLSTQAAFRFRHPPLAIPWSDLEIENTNIGVFGRRAKLRVRGITLQVPSRHVLDRRPHESE